MNNVLGPVNKINKVLSVYIKSMRLTQSSLYGNDKMYDILVYLISIPTSNQSKHSSPLTPIFGFITMCLSMSFLKRKNFIVNIFCNI